MINLEDILILKKGGIHIKPENRGKFTEYCGGKVTEECIRKGKNSPNPLTRKRAAFAGASRTWKHENGGIIDGWNWLKDIFGLNDNLNRWYVGSSKKGNEVKYMSTKEFRDLYRPDPKKEKSIVSETKQDPIINSAIIPIIENGDTTFVDPYGNQVPKERYYAQPKYIDDTQWELNQQHKQNQKKVLKSFYKYRNGGGISMFQNSGKINWRNKTGYIEDPYTNQSGFTSQYTYGDVQKDENKFTYRDSRLQYITPDNKVETNYVREYKPNWRYKKYVKKYGHPTQPHMWTNHANDGTMSTDTFGYTPEQIDSLTTYFNTFDGL